MLIFHFEREMPETIITNGSSGSVAHVLLIVKTTFSPVTTIPELSRADWFNKFCQAMNEGTSSAAGFLGQTSMRTTLVEVLNEESALALTESQKPWSNNPQEAELSRKTFSNFLKSFSESKGQIGTMYLYIVPK